MVFLCLLLTWAPETATHDIAMPFDRMPWRPPRDRDLIQPMQASPAMRRFVRDHVDMNASPDKRLHQLIDAVFGRLAFNYDNRVTRSASEAFDKAKGNCVSFSLMFVSLARQAGLRAYCQEVNDPPDGPPRPWLKAVERHMNVRVRVHNWEHEVDFQPYVERNFDQRIPIDDRKALAHYHNNRAAELLAGQNPNAAMAHLERSLTLYPEFGRAWSNLGVCYRNLDRPGEAEAAFRQALCDEVSSKSAAANLAALYFEREDTNQAEAFYRMVTPHRGRNPYLQFNRAKQALDRGQLTRARKLLRKASRLTPRYSPLGRAIAKLIPGTG